MADTALEEPKSPDEVAAEEGREDVAGVLAVSDETKPPPERPTEEEISEGDLEEVLADSEEKTTLLKRPTEEEIDEKAEKIRQKAEEIKKDISLLPEDEQDAALMDQRELLESLIRQFDSDEQQAIVKHVLKKNYPGYELDDLKNLLDKLRKRPTEKEIHYKGFKIRKGILSLPDYKQDDAFRVQRELLESLIGLFDIDGKEAILQHVFDNDYPNYELDDLKTLLDMLVERPTEEEIRKEAEKINKSDDRTRISTQVALENFIQYFGDLEEEDQRRWSYGIGILHPGYQLNDLKTLLSMLPKRPTEEEIYEKAQEIKEDISSLPEYKQDNALRAKRKLLESLIEQIDSDEKQPVNVYVLEYVLKNDYPDYKLDDLKALLDELPGSL